MGSRHSRLATQVRRSLPFNLATGISVCGPPYRLFLPLSAFVIGYVIFCLVLVTPAATAQPSGAPNSFIRGVLLTGKFRTQVELNAMSAENQRNTLITELTNRTRNDVRFYQGLNDADLAGAGALLVFLRGTAGRTDPQIKTMSADDMRNTVIVAVGAQTHRGADLQGLTNTDLIHLVMGPDHSFIRGVLLTGKFRTQVELNAMSAENQRNTLITELTNRTRNDVRFYQGLNDADLAGAGALLVFLRETAGRTDPQIKTMSADDMRNTVIVAIHAQTHRSDLQGLENIQLADMALGLREVRGLAGVPDFLKPGPHTLVARVNHAVLQNTTRRFSDVPFFGIFIGRDVDCTHGLQFASSTAGTGDSFSAVVGWGQVEGDGHPNSSSDRCVSWISRLSLDFDVTQFVSVPQKTLDRAVLSYHEQAASDCMTLVFTQGGFATDRLPCWTNGDGQLENKANGCLSLRVPNENWITSPPGNVLVASHEVAVQKIAPSSWDITSLFRVQHSPQLGEAPSAFGYMLIGDPLDIGNLTADDNTRCTSLLSDVRLEVTYTVPPIQEIFDPEIPR
jgi:hypothetical protein